MDTRKESIRLAKELERVRARKIRQLKGKIVTGQYQVMNAEVAKSIFLSKR